MYRFTAPCEKLAELAGGLPAPFHYEDGFLLSTFLANDGSNRNAVIYPCRDKQVINFGVAVPDSMLTSPPTEQSWTFDGVVGELLHYFHDYPL
ncbi:hypothetical protein SEUCBS139899_010690 [Sporothrix eucalyptigena]